MSFGHAEMCNHELTAAVAAAKTSPVSSALWNRRIFMREALPLDEKLLAAYGLYGRETHFFSTL